MLPVTFTEAETSIIINKEVIRGILSDFIANPPQTNSTMILSWIGGIESLYFLFLTDEDGWSGK